MLVRNLRLIPNDEGNVLWGERFWNSAYLPESSIVPSLLVFADEFANGDERQMLIAQEMWKKDENLQRFH